MKKVLLKTSYARAKFERFLKDYRHREIRWARDKDNSDIIYLSEFDLHDALNKYFLEDELWENDMDEAFGTLDALSYRKLFEEFFTLVHMESYLAPYLQEIWCSDVEIIGSGFPDSHIVAVGRIH